jgi:hypothetical protein
MLTHYTWWCTLDGVGTFAMEKVLELILINLVKGERFFGVLRTLGWILEWNTALIHCDLDKMSIWVVYPSE